MGDNVGMIRSEYVEPRGMFEGPAYVVHYRTPLREGSRRFGGHRARDKATTFAIEILEELRAHSQA